MISYVMPVILFVAIMPASVVMIVWRAGRTNPVDVLKYE